LDKGEIMATNYADDIIPRTAGTSLRIATFNVENLFSRPIAMDYEDNRVGQPYLDAYAELNSLFAKPQYAEDDKARMLEILTEQKLTGTRPQNKHLEFRKIRGQLVAKRGNRYEIVANGRADWVGWIELKEKEISDRAILNTARVIAAVDADIITLVEVEDRPGLLKFHDNVLRPILDTTGRAPYGYALVVDGNDSRGIDVGILSRFPITDITTHVFDVPGAPPVFSRDCCEYFVDVLGVSGRLIVMANHFASKGSDPTGKRRRIHQARRVSQIVQDRLSQGFTHFVVCGDLNDPPDSASLQPLLGNASLQDAVMRFASAIDPTGKRLGTYETGKQQIDYLLMSPALQSAALAAGIERRGHYAPRSFASFDSVKSSRDAASDHHCVWLDLAF
jgi:endonuclease/exonuclease/phosphatase family metal-dependent hydrolase